MKTMSENKMDFTNRIGRRSMLKTGVLSLAGLGGIVLAAPQTKNPNKIDPNAGVNHFFQMLKKDHIEVNGILAQLDETGKKESEKRDELFQKLKEALVPHMKAEETLFYPALLKKQSAHEDALEAVEEHHVSEMVFKELEKTPKSEDRWGAKMSVFRELVEHHVKEEEGTIFKVAEKAMDQGELESIMNNFEAEKQKIKKNLSNRM